MNVENKQAIPTALLRVVARQLQGKIATPLIQVAGGELSIEDAGKRAFGAFLESHANARYCGRLSAGDKTPIGEADRSAVHLLAEEQQQYFERFAGQLKDGKYRNELGELNEAAVEDRAGLYTMRLRGTANDGWTDSLGEDDLITWNLGNTENNCSICPDLAENSPYKANELPTTPGSNETPCLWNCQCEIQTESGSSPPKSFIVALKFSPQFIKSHTAFCACKS